MSETPLKGLTAIMLLGLSAGAAVAGGEAGYEKGMHFKSDDGAFSVDAGSRIQFRFTQNDPDDSEDTSSFRVRRAKFFLEGVAYEYWKYKVQAVWSGSSTSLEDAYLQYTRARWAQPWVGQGKVLFGRQQLTSSGSQQFVDRSDLTEDAFVPARSQGIALVGQSAKKKFEYNAGIYNDFSGQNSSSNSDNNFMYVARAVYTPFGVYKPSEGALDYPDSSKLAVGVKGLFDTTVSTAPGGADVDNTTLGLEIAYKILGFSLVGEWFDKSVEEAGVADADTDGGYLQAAYLFPNKKAEIAARYAMVTPDVAGASMDSTEQGLAFSWYFDKHRNKVQADYRQQDLDAVGVSDVDEFRVQLQLIF